MSREIDMCPELSGELECLDNALQYRVAPIEYDLSQFHRTFGDPAPDRAVIIEGMRELDPFVFFALIQGIP